ncbi:protein RESPONSE TO LOW SULFUR 2 [Brachypodium distachyon]|uniref:GTD-binding domain-containing protein n=1 Tax=Brachypodium distachyon TaxID=15368 RepID=I1HWU8_BRADI|nr:protein RESPONSE TO LOW SULFUR 2 [Brachypodium distachyon]KQJ93118.1 hypothetical protein BRADI_3g02810v3 [Brachypodium distachyon]|eukprot:XP_003570877.1 protein RESPONSE TO LOW SULFUR 2 [Brachypodium distachyon]
MAPAIGIAIAAPAGHLGWKKQSNNQQRVAAEGGDVAEVEALRRRNAELEKEVAALRAEAEAARRRAEAAEEAEELLCAQLGDAEGEAAEIARAYHAQVQGLARELAAARAMAAAAARSR